MNLIEIPDKEIKLQSPEHWDEMTQEQVFFCLKKVLMATAGLISVAAARTLCMYQVLEIKRDWRTVAWERIQSADRVMEKNANVYLLSEKLFGFLFLEKKGNFEANYNTVINHFPELKAGDTILYGPASLFGDLTLGEFRAAKEEMDEYFESKEEESLNRFIACLYRPKRKYLESEKESRDWDGKVQEQFNRARITDHAQLTSLIGPVHKMAVLLWFTHTIQYVQKEDLMIGGRKVNFSILFPEGESGAAKGSGFTGILYAIAEKGIFGNIEASDRAGFFDVFLFLYDKEIENIRAKAKARATQLKKGKR